MRATKQTNQDVLKVSIIAHKEEWEGLIDLLADTIAEEDDSVLRGFYRILDQVVNNGKSNWNERSEIETREAHE